VKFIKAQRIRWLGYVTRLEVGAMPRKMVERRLFIVQKRGKLHLMWMDDVVTDLKVMQIRQWIEKMKDREQWRLVVEEVKAHPGL
jgi:peroxiredoxin